jgi:hypothetical protein
MIVSKHVVNIYLMQSPNQNLIYLYQKKRAFVNWAFFGTSGPLKKMAHSCQKRPNLHTNELNTTFFCSTIPLKAPNRLKPLKLA